MGRSLLLHEQRFIPRRRKSTTFSAGTQTPYELHELHETNQNNENENENILAQRDGRLIWAQNRSVGELPNTPKSDPQPARQQYGNNQSQTRTCLQGNTHPCVREADWSVVGSTLPPHTTATTMTTTTMATAVTTGQPWHQVHNGTTHSPSMAENIFFSRYLIFLLFVILDFWLFFGSLFFTLFGDFGSIGWSWLG